MPRSTPVNSPPSYTSNQWGYNPSTYQDGRDTNSIERNNLLPQTHNYGSMPVSVRPNISQSRTGLLILVLVLISLNMVTIFYPPMARESTRRQWDAEQRRHQVLRDSWNSERDAMVMERDAWQKERAGHRLEREDLAAEKERWRQEWTARENKERQEEEAKRALIVWQDLKPSSKCLRYGTKEYSATLAHVPIGLDPLKECWNKSVDIHGRQVLPSRCDTQGACGAVVGHWVVDFNEAACVTLWRGYDNKGCFEPGIHRYESVLENLQWGDDWHEMCATTPGHVQGRDFAGPTSCASWKSGINAIWLVEDANCY